MSRIYIHADDFGLTHGINANIFKAWEDGVLHSASIMPNGYAFDEAVMLYNQASFELQVHLNFIEGKALHPQSAGTFFCTADGRFNRSFFTLYTATHSASGAERMAMKRDIKNEMVAQIKKVKNILKPGARLRVDSHQHIHMIPLFFESLSELIDELKIDYIRIPREKTSAKHTIRYYPHIIATSNPAKVMLLNNLSQKAIQLLQNQAVKYPSWFIGILHTGNMKLSKVKHSFDLIKPILTSHDEVEILFHPGQALPEEEHFWDFYPALKKYYRHLNRQKEMQEMLRPELRTWIHQISKQL
ncbi:MAG: ChbG/HpnK family deacetylase [Flavobacteriales bacterium]|nr:ChbG/HpnK family deacetylase [Flavobacteriales bacterium]